jgi:hypothetical protein
MVVVLDWSSVTDWPLHVQKFDEGCVLLLFLGQIKHIPFDDMK